MGAVDAGFDVVDVDVDERRGARAADETADSFIEGSVTSAQLRATLDSGRYRPTSRWSDADGADIFAITVPHPCARAHPT